MAHSLPRTLYHWTRVALATILSDEQLLDDEGNPTLPSLREEASHNGLFYLRIIRHLPHANLYEAHAEALPGLLDAPDPFIVFLSEDQLRFTLPWDVRMQHRTPEQRLTLLSAHAAILQPLVRIDPGHVHTQPVSLASPLTEEVLYVEVDEQDAPTVFTSIPEMDSMPQDSKAFKLQQALLGEVSKRTGTMAMQQAFLRAAIDTLMDVLYQGQAYTQATFLQGCCALLDRVRRWQLRTHQRLVQVLPSFDEHRCRITWQLTIGIPADLAVA